MRSALMLLNLYGREAVKRKLKKQPKNTKNALSNENNLGFHMRYHFFLHYGWFLQNLGKDFIRTNMHTTVCTTQWGEIIS